MPCEPIRRLDTKLFNAGLYAVNAIVDLVKRHLVLIGFVAILFWGFQWRHVLRNEVSNSVAVVERDLGAAISSGIAEQGPSAGRSSFRPTEPMYSNEDTSDVAADLMQAARRAYWIGDLQAADSLYRDYVQRFPSDPNGYGELGNVLLAADKRGEAEDMLLRAARMLDAQGNQNAAASLRNAMRSDGG